MPALYGVSPGDGYCRGGGGCSLKGVSAFSRIAKHVEENALAISSLSEGGCGVCGVCGAR